MQATSHSLPLPLPPLSIRKRQQGREHKPMLKSKSPHPSTISAGTVKAGTNGETRWVGIQTVLLAPVPLPLLSLWNVQELPATLVHIKGRGTEGNPCQWGLPCSPLVQVPTASLPLKYTRTEGSFKEAQWGSERLLSPPPCRILNALINQSLTSLLSRRHAQWLLPSPHR